MNSVPKRIIDSLERYAHEKIETGGFLYKVLSNDLFGAVQCADSENIKCLPEICDYISNALPEECWGTKEKVYDWLY